MIWRGQQYVRAIRLYHQKTNRYPTQLDDLFLPKTGIRFLRKAYKDPMNIADGSWRLIYVGPNGQLIGSLNDHRNAFFFGGSPPANFAGALAASPKSTKLEDPFALPGAPGSNSTFSNALAFGSPNSQNPSTLPNSTGPTASSAVSDTAGDQPADAQQENNQTFGQTLVIGVGSKINKSSIGKYEGADNYRQFEFIWNGLTANSGHPSSTSQPE